MAQITFWTRLDEQNALNRILKVQRMPPQKIREIEIARDLYQSLSLLALTLDRDLSVAYVQTLLRVCMAGDEGIDQGKLVDEIGLSAAGMSRAVRALSAFSYDKRRPGFGVLEFTIDPKDNRRRLIRVTPKGRKLIAALTRPSS